MKELTNERLFCKQNMLTILDLFPKRDNILMGDRVFVPETSNPVERALLNYTPYL
jgi:hypothetical protein